MVHFGASIVYLILGTIIDPSQLPLTILLCGNIASLILVTNYIFTLDTVKIVLQPVGHLPVRRFSSSLIAAMDGLTYFKL